MIKTLMPFLVVVGASIPILMIASLIAWSLIDLKLRKSDVIINIKKQIQEYKKEAYQTFVGNDMFVVRFENLEKLFMSQMNPLKESIGKIEHKLDKHLDYCRNSSKQNQC